MDAACASETIAHRIKELLRAKFPDIQDHREDCVDQDTVTCFTLTDRFWVRLRRVECMGGWLLEFNDRVDPSDWLNVEVPLCGERLLDIYRMHFVVEALYELVVERISAGLIPEG
jgi:hypothetical protein